MSNPPPPPPPSSSSQSHHKPNKPPSHPNPSQNPHHKNSNPASSIKKNVRAWGNVNPNNHNHHHHNNTNNNQNPHHQPGAGPNAWRNSGPNGSGPHHFVNGAIVGQSPSGNSPHLAQPPQQSVSNEEKLVLKAMHDRMVWFIMSLVVC